MGVAGGVSGEPCVEGAIGVADCGVGVAAQGGEGFGGVEVVAEEGQDAAGGADAGGGVDRGEAIEEGEILSQGVMQEGFGAIEAGAQVVAGSGGLAIGMPGAEGVTEGVELEQGDAVADEGVMDGAA